MNLKRKKLGSAGDFGMKRLTVSRRAAAPLLLALTLSLAGCGVFGSASTSRNSHGRSDSHSRRRSGGRLSSRLRNAFMWSGRDSGGGTTGAESW